MALDVGIKIDAVFSLADVSRVGDKYVNKLSDTTDNQLDAATEDVDVDVNACTEPIDKGFIDSSKDSNGTNVAEADVDTAHARTEVDNRKTETDAPPALSLEANNGAINQFFQIDEQPEFMTPPILHPEEPIKSGMEVQETPKQFQETPKQVQETPKQRKQNCKKIAPCYIVLTKADGLIETKTCVSSRAFKRDFTECSNMCKKTHFRRQLEAGKDVFDVKAPSKQTHMYIHLIKIEEERAKKNKQIPIQFPNLKYLLEQHEKERKQKKHSPEKMTLGRVRRTVTKIPKDFALRPTSPILADDEVEQNKEKLCKAELEALNARLAKRMHALELGSLKKLITIKRAYNKQTKKFRKTKKDGLKTFLLADVTSNVSGRVRRGNKRYEGDFAVSKDDIDQQLFERRVETQLKKAEYENKKKVEEFQKANAKFENLRKRQFETGSEEPVSSEKKRKHASIVIDNAEEGLVKNVNKGKVKKKARVDQKFQTLVETNSQKSKLKAPISLDRSKAKADKNADGVLVQDLPREDVVITSFLKNISFGETPVGTPSLESQGYTGMTSAPLPHVHQYARARQMLKESLAKHADNKQTTPTEFNPNIKIKVEPGTEPSSHISAADEEKFKLLKIPANVQKLFIKKEPGLEEATCSTQGILSFSQGMTPSSQVMTLYSSTAPIGTSSTVTSGVPGLIAVTVACTGGTFKRVFLTSKPTTTPGIPTPRSNLGPLVLKSQDGASVFVSPATKQLPMGTSLQNPSTLQSKVTTTTVSSSQPVVSLANYSIINSPQSSVTAKVVRTDVKTSNIGVIPSVLQIHAPGKTTVQYINPPNQASAKGLLKSPQSSKSLLQPVSNVRKIDGGTSTRSNERAVSQSKSLLPQSAPALRAPVGTKPTDLRRVTLNARDSVPVKDSKDGDEIGKKNMDKCKFYLLKIDGKNVLIPIEGNKTQPKAYVMNNDVLSTNTQNEKSDPSRTGNLKMTPSTGSTPTFTGPQINHLAQIKPTVLVQPINQKVSETPILRNQSVIAAPAKSLLQLTPTTTAQAGVQTVTVYNAPVIASTSLNQNAKTQTPLTLVSSSASNPGLKSPNFPPLLLTTKTSAVPQAIFPNVQMQGKVLIPNLSFVTGSTNLVPIYLPATQISDTNTGTTYINDASSNSTARVPAGIQITNETASSKNASSAAHGNPVLKTVNDGLIATKLNNDKSKIKIIQKTGSTVEEAKANKTNEDKLEENSKPFLEGVTAREERLRKLKELLKQRHQAVEEIREWRAKADTKEVNTDS